MARILCGISNVPFKCDHVPMVLQNREYNHPIFSLPQKKLLGLYSVYNKGELSDIDSYLLFLALLKSTEAVQFISPAIITEATVSIIAKNLGSLVQVIWETNAIVAPSFKQPKFYLRSDTATLDNISVWIAAWRSNIEDFKQGTVYQSQHEALVEVEKRLTKLIFTPEAGQIKLAAATADWADKAACFPVAKREEWKLTIRKCYNLEAMFSTPKELLIEIKCFCEENIEAGSIQFHTLMQTLRTGIANHNDFLGLGSFNNTTKKASGASFTLLSADTSIEEASMLAIIASAPKNEPVIENYPNKLAFLQAKLAYRQAAKLGSSLDTSVSSVASAPNTIEGNL